jgi:hypothetical protein
MILTLKAHQKYKGNPENTKEIERFKAVGCIEASMVVSTSASTHKLRS